MRRSPGRRQLIAAAVLGGAALALALTGVPRGAAAPDQASVQVAADDLAPRLFFLNIRGQVLSAEPDGSDLRVLADELGTMPDGIAVDPVHGHVYWSNMGASKSEDGSVMRSDLDGGNLTTIVPSSGTFTAKQLQLDEVNGKLYWADREGMRIQRVNLDGTGLETIVEIATGEEARLDAANWAVGMAVDPEGGHFYWTQKGGDNEGVGVIRRARIDMPAGQTAANRSDIETLFAGLPEPIDLALDLPNRVLYWTDRGDPPIGNTVNRAPMDPPAGFDPMKRADHEILVRNLDEAIGISLDLERDRMYFTDLRGSLYSARLDGSDFTVLGSGMGALTGIAVADVPPHGGWD